MSTIDRVGIKEKLIAAIDREMLPNREVARILNIHPCYISMVKNEKLWDSITSNVWNRFNEWLLTRDTINNFQIPEGEEIYKVKEKEAKKAEPAAMGPQFIAVYGHTEPIKPEPKKKLKKVKEPVYTADYVKGLEERIDYQANKLMEANNQIIKYCDLVKDLSDTPANTADIIRQRVSLDIEINLVVNGQKVRL